MVTTRTRKVAAAVVPAKVSSPGSNDSTSSEITLTDKMNDLSTTKNRAGKTKATPQPQRKNKKPSPKKRLPPSRKAPLREIDNSQKQEKTQQKNKEGNDNNDSSDDESDDDIGEMLKAVQTRRRQKAANLSDDDDDSDKSSDDDSDKDADSDNGSVAVIQPGGMRTRFSQRYAQKKKQSKLQRAAKRAVGGKSGNDSDDDSGSEVEVTMPYTSNKRSKTRDSLDTLSSDDEESQVKKAQPKKASDEFSVAMEKLKSAQAYEAAKDADVEMENANDNDDEDDDDDDVVCLDDAPQSKSEAAAPKNLGQPIDVKLRTNEGGKTREQILKIRMNEPMSALMEKYAEKNNIAKSKRSKVTFHFDGEQLNPNATPASLDMEDDELIDVVIKK